MLQSVILKCIEGFLITLKAQRQMSRLCDVWHENVNHLKGFFFVCVCICMSGTGSDVL